MAAANHLLSCAAVSSPFDPIWLDAAARLGIPVRRGGDAYVHWDGRTLHIATDEHLDDDDTLAQLVFHEICHAITQGPERLAVPDWGLDNTSTRDDDNERAAVRLQAHLLGAHGLRGLLHPTTEVRVFFEALPADAFAALPERFPADRSIPTARLAALRAASPPWAPVLRAALARTAALAAPPVHRTGHALGDAALRCGDCAFRSAGGLCRKAERRTFVARGERACARFEAALDCLACGACCRSAYDAVPVSARDPVRRLHPQLIDERDGGFRSVRRRGDRCAALEGPPGGPFRCVIYADRPRNCRDFEAGGRHCLEARRRVGLSF